MSLTSSASELFTACAQDNPPPSDEPFPSDEQPQTPRVDAQPSTQQPQHPDHVQEEEEGWDEPPQEPLTLLAQSAASANARPTPPLTTVCQREVNALTLIKARDRQMESSPSSLWCRILRVHITAVPSVETAFVHRRPARHRESKDKCLPLPHAVEADMFERGQRMRRKKCGR